MERQIFQAGTLAAGLKRVVVAGHICLDIIPEFPKNVGPGGKTLVPGKLIDVGPVRISTGGAVSNAGVALHRLGVPVSLMGKVGDDMWGQVVLDLLHRHDPALAQQMIVVPGENTSYSVVISPPDSDRIFLHFPGANDTFQESDLPYHRLVNAAVFHFGYPPLMRRMYDDGGTQLTSLLATVKKYGLITSLDMALPDPVSPAGKTDWKGLLRMALPQVDLFIPSLEETLFMVDRERFGPRVMAGEALSMADGALLSDIAGTLMEMGAPIVALKLGNQGLYLRTAASPEKLWFLADAPRWAGHELLAPCFQVDVAGTTGAGDCTAAGFILGLLLQFSPAETVIGAVGVGACCVEQADAISGVPPWEQVQKRIAAGWSRRKVDIPLKGWKWDETVSVWRGPADRRD